MRLIQLLIALACGIITSLSAENKYLKCELVLPEMPIGFSETEHPFLIGVKVTNVSRRNIRVSRYNCIDVSLTADGKKVLSGWSSFGDAPATEACFRTLAPRDSTTFHVPFSIRGTKNSISLDASGFDGSFWRTEALSPIKKHTISLSLTRHTQHLLANDRSENPDRLPRIPIAETTTRSHKVTFTHSPNNQWLPQRFDHANTFKATKYNAGMISIWANENFTIELKKDGTATFREKGKNPTAIEFRHIRGGFILRTWEKKHHFFSIKDNKLNLLVNKQATVLTKQP